MRNRLFFLLFVSLVVVPACSQLVRDMWLSMPDSLVGYLNKSKRIEALDYCDMGVKLDVTNLLRGSTQVDTLTHDFMQVQLNDAALLQLKALPYGSDSVLCVVKTLFAPEAESMVAVYDTGWNLLEIVPLGYDDADSFFQRPDTMPVSHFEEKRRMIEPVMVRASLSAEDNLLILELSMPLLTAEEKSSVKAILKQRKLKWADGKFIEC